MMCFIRYFLAIFLVSLSARSSAGAYEDAVRSISNGDPGSLASVLQRGLDVDSVNREGDTLLMLASKEGNINVINVLLKLKAKVNAKNGLGETALMLAAVRGHLEVVKLLLGEGALLEGPGWTPLMYAASTGKLEVMRLDRKSTRLNSSHIPLSRMPSSA